MRRRRRSCRAVGVDELGLEVEAALQQQQPPARPGTGAPVEVVLRSDRRADDVDGERPGSPTTAGDRQWPRARRSNDVRDRRCHRSRTAPRVVEGGDQLAPVVGGHRVALMTNGLAATIAPSTCPGSDGAPAIDRSRRSPAATDWRRRCQVIDGDHRQGRTPSVSPRDRSEAGFKEDAVVGLAETLLASPHFTAWTASAAGSTRMGAIVV